MPLVADLMSLAASASEFSQAVPTGNANAVQACFLVVTMPSGTLTVRLQGSCDRMNWVDLATYSNIALGYSAPAATTGVGLPFLRVKPTAPGTGIAIVSIGLYPFKA